VLGIGTEFRRDDGVGRAVLAELAHRDLPGVELLPCDGEPTQLLEAWAGVPLAVVVDAVQCEPPRPGRIHRVSLPDPRHQPATASTHGLGVPEAVRLAGVLDRAPDRLVVFAVEAADTGFGVGLSDDVAGAVPVVADRIVAELRARP
jgi:hydrogenase maturation protease